VHLWSGVWRSRRVLVADLLPECTPCVHAAIAEAEIDRFRRDGDQVIAIARHPDLVAPDDLTVISSADGVPTIDADPEHISYVLYPGTPVEEAAAVIRALRTRFPRIRGQHPEGFCYNASDNAESVRAVAATDAMFILTHGDDTIARSTGTTAHVIDHPRRIPRTSLAGAESIGIAVVPSAPPALFQEVIDVLSGLGPMSLVSRRVVTEPIDLNSRLRPQRCRSAAAPLPRRATARR
jgi:4-hydroxy-3-methylbut-2-en-1-yl diphosphate reductase